MLMLAALGVGLCPSLDAATIEAVPGDYVETGTLAIAADETVNLTVASDASLVSAINAGGTLVKLGSGTLTLKPQPGYYPGAIEVRGGKVRLVGTGATELPGMFGKLTVAAGASVEVAESPAADRHGAVTRVVPRDGWNSWLPPWGGNVMGLFKGADVSDASRVCVYTPEDRGHYLSWTYWLPSAYRNADYFNAYTAALLVVPETANYAMTFWADDKASLFIDGDRLFNEVDGTAKSALKSYEKGWHYLVAALNENTGDQGAYFTMTGAGYGADYRITGQHLWRGVCVSDLVLEDGASLAIADGQALAVLPSGETDVQGPITGGEASILAVAAGRLPLDATKLSGFAGSLEACGFGTLALSNQPVAPTYTVVGKGRLEIPSGTIYTRTSETGLTFVGEGTLLTANLEGTSDFAGEVVMADGATLTLDSPARAARGSACSDWNSAGSWTIGGAVGSNSANRFTGHIATVQSDGSLLLNDDTGQHNYAILNQHGIGRDDVFEASFLYSPRSFNRDGESLSAQFSVSFTSDPAAFSDSDALANTYMIKSDAYGFNLEHNPWNSSSIRWITGGVRPEDALFTESQTGINFKQPFTVNVRLANDTLVIAFVQGEKRFEAACEVKAAFANGARRYLMVGAASGQWDDWNHVYVGQTLSDFKARVFGSGSVDQAGFAPFSDTSLWQRAGDGVRLDDAGNLNFAWQAMNCGGKAVCQTPIPTRQPFTVEFHERITDTGNYWAEGISVFVQGEQSASSDIWSWRYFPATDKSVSFGHQFWDNYFFWTKRGGGMENKSSNSPNGVAKSVGRSVIRFSHDGCGNFKALVRRGDSVYESTFSCPEALTWGDNLYLGFMGADSNWGSYRDVHIENVQVSYADKEGLSQEKLAVQSEAQVNLAVDPVSGAQSADTTFGEVSLGADSTLSIGKKTTSGAVVALDRIMADEAARIVASEDVVLEIRGIVSGGTVSVSGPWTVPEGVIRIYVDPATETRKGLKARLPLASYQGEGKPVVKVFDLDGNALSGYTSANCTGTGNVYLQTRGFIFGIR